MNVPADFSDAEKIRELQDTVSNLETVEKILRAELAAALAEISALKKALKNFSEK